MTEVPMITLNDGMKMPQLGFGVFQVPDLNQCEVVVSAALDAGYRLIDTAAAYQNETAVGQALQKSAVPREEIFVTSKLWVSDFTYKRAKAGIDASLKKLNVDYMDLYLLHQAYGDTMGAWRALEEAQKAGKIRSIGVSNFFPDQLKNLELTMAVKPVINQIEINPWYQRPEDVQFIQSEGIQAEAWAPFAEGKQGIFTNSVLGEIAEKHGKSVGQVILRWLLQRQITVIPKSVHPARITENLDVFDFQLNDEDMTRIATLDQQKSQFFDHRDPTTIQQIFGSSLAKLK